MRKTERGSREKRCKIQLKEWTDKEGEEKGKTGKREDRYKCQTDTNSEWSAEEEKDRVKVRSCEAESAAKSHTDCTYSKPWSESG